MPSGSCVTEIQVQVHILLVPSLGRTLTDTWQHDDHVSSRNTTWFVAITLLVVGNEKPNHNHLVVKEMCCSRGTESRAPSGYTPRLSSAKSLADAFSFPTSYS